MTQANSLKLGILNTLVFEGNSVLAEEPTAVHFQRLFAAVTPKSIIPNPNREDGRANNEL